MRPAPFFVSGPVPRSPRPRPRPLHRGRPLFRFRHREAPPFRVPGAVPVFPPSLSPFPPQPRVRPVASVRAAPSCAVALSAHSALPSLCDNMAGAFLSACLSSFPDIVSNLRGISYFLPAFVVSMCLWIYLLAAPGFPVLFCAVFPCLVCCCSRASVPLHTALPLFVRLVRLFSRLAVSVFTASLSVVLPRFRAFTFPSVFLSPCFSSVARLCAACFSGWDGGSHGTLVGRGVIASEVVYMRLICFSSVKCLLFSCGCFVFCEWFRGHRAALCQTVFLHLCVSLRPSLFFFLHWYCFCALHLFFSYREVLLPYAVWGLCITAISLCRPAQLLSAPCLVCGCYSWVDGF